ncbi:MAG: PilT/PilU family type 4a pilus ATPase [Clostridiales bacterium]|nr:PilT/PilU family type 4a pilus ATPase [Clostridiales bacterium]
MELLDILKQTLNMGGSDIFIVPGSPVMVKVKGHLESVFPERVMPEDTEKLIHQTYELAKNREMTLLLQDGDDDFSFSLERLCRFRCNAYRQRGTLAAAYRVLTFGLPDPRKLNIPELVIDLATLRNGMVLVTGPAGSGKSTTLACIVDCINQSRSGHIITIEDPIEYLHGHRRSLVSQREVPADAPTFARALRAALRQAPDVIMLGEMRDEETMQTAITAAETGHLLLSSLHTVGAAKTIDRIVDAFPPNQQQQVRIQLSMVLRAVVSQRLVPTLDGGLAPVFEVMTVTSAVQNLIREGKTYQLDNVIYTGSAEQTMLSMDNELLRLCRDKRIARETAILYAVNPDALRKRLPM